MGLLDRIKGLLSRGMTYADFFGEGGGPRFTDAFGTRRAPNRARLVEAYQGVIYTCAQINTRKLVRTPLRLYATTAKGQRSLRVAHTGVSRSARLRLGQLGYLARDMAGSEGLDEVLEHPLLDALDGRGPDHATLNPYFDRAGLLEFMGLQLEIMGDFIARWEDNGFGAPAVIWPFPADQCTPIRDGKNRVTTWSHAGEEIPAERLLWISLRSMRNPYGQGMSPAEAAWSYVDLETKSLAVKTQLLDRGPMPSAVVGPADSKMPFGPDEIKRLKLDLRRQFTGGAGGGLLFTNGAFVYTPLTYKPADLAAMGISELELHRIANCFGVPLPLLLPETNLANLQAAEAQHAPVIESRAQRIAAALTRLAKQLDPRLFFAFDEVSEEDEAKAADLADKRLKNGSLTINEARAACGYDPVPWGNEPWLPSTLRQPSEERPKPALSGMPGKGPGFAQDEAAGEDGESGGRESGGDPGASQGDQDESQGRALDVAVLDLVERIAGRLDREANDPGAARELGWFDGAAAAPTSAPEPARSAPGGADPQDPAPVVSDPAEGNPGHDASGWHGGSSDEIFPNHRLQRQNGLGDDSDSGGLLAGGGEGSKGALGAGPGRMESDGSEPGESDRSPGVRLLRSDEQDDRPGAEPSAGEAAGGTESGDPGRGGDPEATD